MFGFKKKQKAEEIFNRIQVIVDDIASNWTMFKNDDGKIVEYTKITEADIVGFCVYYAASVCSPKVATEITNLYGKTLDNRNFNGVDLMLRLNSTYQ